MATPSRTPRRAAVALLAALALGGCDKGGPSEPVPGELVVTLRTPFAGDRGMVVSVSGPGPIGAVTSASTGLQVFARASGGTARAAVFGTLADGDILRLSVPDTRQAGAYSATVVEASDLQNQPRASVASYALTVSRAGGAR